MNTANEKKVTTKIFTETHRYGDQSQAFFCVRTYVNGKNHMDSNWMTVVDGEVHDAFYGVEDSTYVGEKIPTSPMVNVPTSCTRDTEAFDHSLLPTILAVISQHVGFEVNVPMICEGEGAEQIRALKELRGYVLADDDYEFIPA